MCCLECFRCPEAICGVDVDDLCAYKTGKYVLIRDRRLGLAYFGALFGVCMYIGVYTLAYKLAYLDFKTVTGIVRFKLQQPVVDDCDIDAPSCLDAFPATTTLQYCCAEGCRPVPAEGEGACNCGRKFTNYHCGFYDGDSVGIPQRSGIFLATRMRTERQTMNTTCNRPGSTSCAKLWTMLSQPTTFVAGIENFTLLLDHSAQVPELNFFHQARDLYGMLHVPGTGAAEQRLCDQDGAYDAYHGGSPTRRAPCYLEPSHPQNSTLDIFHVQTLLAAAGVDLDAESYKGSNHSARYEGMTMLLNIRYYNAVPWKGLLREPGYVYEVTAMRQNAYGQHQVTWDPDRRGRTVIATHGIYLQGNLVGPIAGFDFNNLVLQLAASLALLAGATTSVNFTARYLMRYRAYYTAALIDRTADFSDVVHLEALPTEDLRRACRDRSLAAGGRRVELISRLIADDYNDHAASPSASPSIVSARSAPFTSPAAAARAPFTSSAAAAGAA